MYSDTCPDYILKNLFLYHYYMHTHISKDNTDTVELILAQYSLIKIQIRLNKDIWAEKSIGDFLASDESGYI